MGVTKNLNLENETKQSYASALLRNKLVGEENEVARPLRFIPGDRRVQTSFREGTLLKPDRFRTYPCLNFVLSGGCPYHERCTYLHDPRLKSDRVVYRTNTIAKPPGIEERDTFYWPDIKALVNKKTNEEFYVIPSTFVETKSNMHDIALFSLWNHFVAYLTLLNGRSGKEGCKWTQDLKESSNRYIGKPRLNIFVDLADRCIVETPKNSCFYDDINKINFPEDV